MDNGQIFLAILLAAIAYVLYIYLTTDCLHENFENVPDSNVIKEATDISSTDISSTDTSSTDISGTAPQLVKINIIEYYTEDSGVTVAWSRPNSNVDYLAIIKAENGEEVKMFFKDTIAADCEGNTCRYSFQNLENGREYSLVLSTITEEGMSNFSNKIVFTPTYQRMKCNANGTCSVMKSEQVKVMDTKLDTLMENKDAAKEVLAKCQGMLDSGENIYDITQIYEADGGFKSVKSQLQYPEHLLLPIKKGPDSLAELVKHQLELGIVNINVHNKNIADAIKKENDAIASAMTVDASGTVV